MILEARANNGELPGYEFPSFVNLLCCLTDSSKKDNNKAHDKTRKSGVEKRS